MYRTDPIKDDGTFDVDFFASTEFKLEQQSLIRYLTLEGFESIKEEFFIDYQSRRWHIRPIKKKTK